MLLNDIHSQPNETRLYRVVRRDTITAIQVMVCRARAEGRAGSSGSRFKSWDGLTGQRRVQEKS